MDDVTTILNKSKDDEMDDKETIQKNKQDSEKMNALIFDETLKQINQILNNLEEKSNTKKEQLGETEEPKTNINNLNDSGLLPDKIKKNIINEVEEHIIDNNVLSMNELHAFDEKDKKKENKSLGFYSSLVLIIIFLFLLYGVLTISKNFIILKYPMSEPYIMYFYEIVEIVKITVFNFFY